jgi:hypothetical protein
VGIGIAISLAPIFVLVFLLQLSEFSGKLDEYL